MDILHFIEGIPDDMVASKEVVDCDQITALLNGEIVHSDVPRSLVDLVGVCQDAKIPHQYIEIIGRLILTRNRADVIEGPKNASHVLMLNTIAQYIVKVFLQCTISFDLVVLALDDVLNMDEMSWKVIELLYHHSLNLMIIGTTRPVDEESLKIDKEFWRLLHDKGVESKQFTEIRLSPMMQSDVEQLIAASLGRNGDEIDPRISRDVYNQSGGMPNLASEILENFYTNNEISQRTGRPTFEHRVDVGNIGELVLNRMDSLPSSVRTHLNLGAILGNVFELLDVVSVFEQYRGVHEEERLKHAKSVHESLEEAVRKGILEVATKENEIHARYSSSDHPYAASNTTYKFTHDVWRSNILRLTLDEWKRDMHTLIAQSMEKAMDEDLASDYRTLTKLFSHWKESGSARQAAVLALKMGRSLESMGLSHQSLLVYRESLDMWKSMDSNDVHDGSIGGKQQNCVAV